MNKIIRKKNENYTIVSNVILRDSRITLKSKGLMALVMSLPPNWDFTIRGLIAIVREGRDAIYASIKELKQFGYCDVIVCRDERGKLLGNDYVFYEEPHLECDNNSPYTENPYTDNPDTENTPQIIKEENKEKNISSEVDDDVRVYKDVVAFYNKAVEGTGMPRCLKATEKRKRSIEARVRELGIEKVYEAITKASASSFCRGGGPRGWKADIDFIINPNSIIKILEGKYDNTSSLPIGFDLNNNSDKYNEEGW